jgi:hypothetical protein
MMRTLRTTFATVISACLLCLSVAAFADPSIEEYAVPPTLHHLQADVVHTKANFDVLKAIGPGFADGYRVTSATYSYTAPETLTISAHAGVLSASQTYTNTTRRTDFGFIHRTDDISSDITRRQTIFSLGLLPQNYLDTMRAQYLGESTVNGIPCDIFMLQYVTDLVTDKRKFEIWVSKSQHYVVQKRVWDGGGTQHETVVYSNPVQALPGVWVPTVVEAFDKSAQLGGIAEQRNIKAD